MTTEHTGVSPGAVVLTTVSVGIVGFLTGLVIGLSIGVFL